MDKFKILMIDILFIFFLLICSETLATDEETYIISNKEELVNFASQVNNGNSFENVTVKLNRDIDLQCDENSPWEAIGWSNSTHSDFKAAEHETFKGTFDGDNHVISGIYMKGDKGFQGFFGINEGIIKNLTVIDSYIEVNDLYAGHIAAYNSGGKIINCKNYSNIVCNADSGAVGGIVGYSTGGDIIDCANYGNIKGTTGGIGGIVGYTWGNDLIKCKNYGDVENHDFVAGGVIGMAQTTWIYESFNEGNIIGTVAAGGIAGQLIRYSNVRHCYNIGNIKNTGEEGQRVNVGGLIGFLNLTEGDEYYLRDSYNVGKIEYIETKNNTPEIGQIAGSYKSGMIENCYYINENTTVRGFGTSDIDETGKVQGKSSEELKSNSILQLLNGTITQEDIDSKINETYNLYNEESQAFVISDKKNSGYPILYWYKDKRTLGDVNDDGEVDLKDIMIINKHRLNKVTLTGEDLYVGDVNKDGNVDFKDILQINKYRLGKISIL